MQLLQGFMNDNVRIVVFTGVQFNELKSKVQVLVCLSIEVGAGF